MKLDNAQYQKLHPLIIELANKRGHPDEIRFGELTKALQDIVPDHDLEYLHAVCWKDLPKDCNTAVDLILSRLEREVLVCCP